MRALSFKSRAIFAVLFTSGVAVLVACGAFLAYDWMIWREAVAEKQQTHLQSVARNSVAALHFEDADAAAEILRSLNLEPTVVSATLLTRSGQVLATYHRDGAEAAEAERGQADDSDLLVARAPIEHRGDRVGSLIVKSDISAMDTRMARFGLIVLAALGGSLSIAAMMASRLLTNIVAPVSALAKVAQKVSTERDYTARAVKVHDDEVGSLTDAFNQMLAEIQIQQDELRHYSDHLHDLVEERTRDLALATATAEEAARSLRRSERRFRSLSAGAPIGIFQLDPRGGITYCNPYLQATLAMGASELAGDGWRVLLREEDRAHFTAAWAGMVESGGELDREVGLVVQGEERWIHLRSLPLAGRSEGFVGTVEDITARRVAEAERAAMIKDRIRLSREAGMAEIATSVLHNVGNVLNSVNVSASVVAERLRTSITGDLNSIAQLLEAQGDGLGRFFSQDPRGPMLPGFIRAVGVDIDSDRQALSAELDALIHNVDHIKRIVKMQQSFARVGGVAEEVEPSVLVEEAVALGVSSLERHGIEVVREYEQMPPIVVDKHRVLQILINLIGNAKHAVVDHDPTIRRVTLRCLRPPEGGARIEIQDSGVGIPPENLDRIFTFGFTTRARGHGFGLHSSANTAQQLGGRLWAESPGVGGGATFILTMPASPPASADEELGRDGGMPGTDDLQTGGQWYARSA